LAANKAEHDRALAAIANVPPPTDPVMTDSGAAGSLAVERRREEWNEQTKLL
jgi:hypothetical protein